MQCDANKLKFQTKIGIKDNLAYSEFAIKLHILVG